MDREERKREEGKEKEIYSFLKKLLLSIIYTELELFNYACGGRQYGLCLCNFLSVI